MARPIDHTLVLEGTLVARTPIHLGGADSGATTDMALAVDGKDRYYLPGTALAGALSAGDPDNHGDKRNARWGFAKDDQGHASFIIVDDAPVIDQPSAELWHGVGIDRHTGSAAKGIKFDREVLPAGTRFQFRLSCEVPHGDDRELGEARQFVGQLCARLRHGFFACGGSTTRGFGKLVLEDVHGSETCWTQRDSVLSWLKDEATTKPAWLNAQLDSAGLPDTTRITLHWHPLGPLMSKAARDGIGADTLPFVSQKRDQHGKPVQALTLPGSAIKGSLRSHAERIMRTVLALDTDASRPHYEQVNVPLVSTLFGAARPMDPKKAKRVDTEASEPASTPTPDTIPKASTPATQGGRGLLAVDTCYSHLALPRDTWDKLDQGDDATAWCGHKKLTRADHVAIDRWTGGASDAMLFNSVEPAASVQWDPIQLTITRRNNASNNDKDITDDHDAALALLWLVLRDMADGQIPLGFGTRRGYGALAVEGITVQHGGETHAFKVRDRIIDETDAAPFIDTLKSAWQAWLEQNPQDAQA